MTQTTQQPSGLSTWHLQALRFAGAKLSWVSGLLYGTSRLPLMALAAVLLMAGTLSNAQAQTNPKIVDIEGQLQSLRKVYDAAAKKDPKNTGAIRLRTKIDNVLAGIGGFQAGQINAEEFLLTIEDGVTEASRYPTDNARNTLKAFQDLQKVVKESSGGAKPEDKPTDAGADETEPDGAATEPETVDPADLPQAKVAISSESKDKQQDVEKVIYLLFGVYLVAIIVMGLMLSNAHKKNVKMLLERVVKIEQRLENREAVGSGPSGPSDATFIQKELGKRIEALENNTVAFLEQMEQRLTALELHAAAGGGSATQAAGGGVAPEEFQQVMQRVRFLETQIGTGLVAPAQRPAEPAKLAIKTGSIPTADLAAKARKGDPGTSEALESIANAVEHLSTRTQIPRLQHHAGQLLPNLMVATKQGSLESLEIKTLGETLQLAYASALNEGFKEQYRDMSEAARKLDFIIEDRMSGRMCFSDHYAENIPFDEYLTLAKVRNTDYPNFVEVKRKIENSELYKTALNNMVLYTLKPTVIQHKDGVKNVICKGIYVIKT